MLGTHQMSVVNMSKECMCCYLLLRNFKNFVEKICCLHIYGAQKSIPE